MAEKTLTVYFSRKGYTEKIAKQAAGGGDIYKIETPERTKGYLGFWWCGRFGMHRWGMDISLCPYDIASYDKVILASPVWVFTLSAPVRRFITENAGKIKSAEYIFVHFSSLMKYKKTVSMMDTVLGLKSTPYTSVCCMWGKVFKKKSFR